MLCCLCVWPPCHRTNTQAHTRPPSPFSEDVYVPVSLLHYVLIEHQKLISSELLLQSRLFCSMFASFRLPFHHMLCRLVTCCLCVTGALQLGERCCRVCCNFTVVALVHNMSPFLFCLISLPASVPRTVTDAKQILISWCICCFDLFSD